MNCARCSSPVRHGGRPALDLRRGQSVKLRRTGDTWRGEEKYICPACNAIFWFPKHHAEFSHHA